MSGHSTAPRGRVTMSRRRWVVVAVGVFLAIDALLVGIAFNATRPGPQRTPGPIPTFGTASPSATVAPSASPSPSPSPAAVAALPAPRFLAPVSASEAWRASLGACPGTAAVVERTADKGATWQPRNTDPVRQVFSMINVDKTHATLIGAVGEDCKVGLFTTADAGKSWQEHTENLGNTNYLDIRDPSTLHTPAGTEAAPCPSAAQLRYNSAATVVLCKDAVFERTRGAGWTEVTAPGALTVATTPDGYAIAVAGAEGCAGLQIATLPAAMTSGTTPKVVGCAASITAPDQATLSQSGKSLWLWSGNIVLISPDGGATWPTA